MSNSLSISLEYNFFLQECYQKLCDLPGFVLLESTDTFRGRYDILTAYPYERVVIKDVPLNKQTVVDELCRLIPLQSTTSTSDLPFQGGAIGYISYDFGAQMQGIISNPQETLSDMPLVDLGLYDWAIIVDHYLKKVTLFSANAHTTTKEIIQEVLSIWRNSAMPSKVFEASSAFLPLISKMEYREAYNTIYQALKEGRAYQVNYTQPYHADYNGDTWGIYKKVSRNNSVPYSAFMRGSCADILSFSPERFLLYEQGYLLTSPIKGTIHRSHDPVVDEHLKNELRLSAKNEAENIMIVDLLRNDLGRIAKPGSVKVSNLCSLQSYNAVHHLVSDIEASCVENLHPFEAFMSCFPGGSITGAPKRESMKIIQEQEPYARGVYCGSIGYFSRHGRFDTNIAIRTITAKQNKLHLAAGGGIVIDSECEEEYRECITKITAIINGLK